MESSENYASNDASWTAAANWTIVAGSLVNSLTFESTPSLIRDDDSNDHHQISPVDSKSKPPLILYTPPDSAPCEITINFAQKHEVRQVYVRSTARVYEIYSAPELQSSSEYLCTVRCDIAARNEEVQHATNIEAAVLAHARSSIQELAEEKLRNGRILPPNEDDWVEVRVYDSPPVINRNSSSDSDMNPKRNSQDLYEATTEITDSKPSTSLTIRLLALQNKGYVCVDELYVFGDPVGTNSLDNQVSSMENSVGNSRMAMRVPAFFQLSKTKGIGGGEDRYNIDTRERQELQEIESKEAAPVDAEKKIQEGARLHKVVGPTSKPVQHEILQQVSNTENKSDISRSHCEGVLDQLFSRVNRIEDLLSRFEESINNIDVRLQRVEQQLDVLTKKIENSVLVSCTRISAPEFSCSESETNSFYNSGSGDISDMACEANKSHSPSPLTSFLADATPVSVNDTNLQPVLVVTAPEFSNYDDEVEENHVVSIDDALAYAPAGFLSSSSMWSQKYSQTIAVKAPDFPTEEENTSEKVAPPVVESELNIDTSTYFSESDGTEHIGNSLFYVANITTLKDDENLMRSLDDENLMRSLDDDRSLKMVEGVDEQCHHSEDHVVDRQELQEIGSKEVAPVDAEKKIQEDVRLYKVVRPTSKPVQHGMLEQVLNTESKSDISRNHCEGVLDQLFSRVNRIEVEDHVVESVKESSKVKENHVVSIDDALAYAPAGFLSSSSMWSQKYSQTIAVKAPDFPIEEENTNERVAPPVVESELNIDTSTYFSESDGTEHMGNSLFYVSNITTLKDDENLMRSLDDDRSLKMVEGVDEQCHHSEDHAVERQELQEIGSKEAAPVDAEKKTQEEARLHKVVGPTSKPVQHEILQQVSNTESKSDISRSHCEGALDQLFSRVNRIEDLLLRFEESMLKPINSIDVRLQQVEKQLDVLEKKLNQRPAPSITMGVEILVVWHSPEFSNYDDEVEDHAVELVKESPKVKENHVVSIDDALAYAPAGFLSSCSMWSQKYSQTVAVKAPDFPTVDTNEKVVPLMDDENLMRSLDDDRSLKMVEGVDEQCHHSEDHAVERQKLEEIGSKEAVPVDAEKKIQEDVRLHRVVRPTSKPVQHEVLEEVSNTESKSDISRSHCEGFMNQLVSRVNRNEDLIKFSSN
ncbi:40S ribosomal protein [Salix suchowensis]|nr:40S ribosomal protein [Salix suchowensis]